MPFLGGFCCPFLVKLASKPSGFLAVRNSPRRADFIAATVFELGVWIFRTKILAPYLWQPMK
jgi:hypothetical protein